MVVSELWVKKREGMRTFSASKQLAPLATPGFLGFCFSVSDMLMVGEIGWRAAIRRWCGCVPKWVMLEEIGGSKVQTIS